MVRSLLRCMYQFMPNSSQVQRTLSDNKELDMRNLEIAYKLYAIYKVLINSLS